MAPTMIEKPDDLSVLDRYVGQLGVSEWKELTQEDIDAFADATGDHQFIHVDPAAARNGPFGGTIAHGYYQVSLIPVLLPEIFGINGYAMAINYGLDKVRFPEPLRVGERFRLEAELLSWRVVEGGIEIKLRAKLEILNNPKPSCVAEVIYRYYE